MRPFATFLCRLGSPAYVPDATLTPREHANFFPRILPWQEMRQLLQAVDHLVPTARAPLRHLTMPAIFRRLYGCGFRLGEVWNLRGREVDLDQGIRTVRQGKWRKDRLVPPAPSLVKRLRTSAAHFGHRPPEAFFLPAPNGGPYGLRTVYGLCRPLLLACGLPHAGRGQGPRGHDLRHTLAVHTRMRWYRAGAERDATLPLLATYLGHQHLSGTQRYLQLTAALFPDLMARANAAFGEVMPRRVQS